jgi:hypothetical protein
MNIRKIARKSSIVEIKTMKPLWNVVPNRTMIRKVIMALMQWWKI